MSEPCRKCSKPLGRADRFCGTCGEPTARCGWRGPERDDWTHGSGKVALAGARGTVAIALRNEGVLSLEVGVAADPEQRTPPPWLDAAHMAALAKPLVLGPGEERALEIRLVPKAIEQALQPSLSRIGQRVALSHPIRLITTAAQAGAPIGHPPTFEVTVAIARVPWLDPPGVHFPFLAAEHLAGGGLPCELDLVNDSADDITLLDCRVVDSDALSGLDGVEVSALVFDLPEVKGTTVPAGVRRKLSFRLRDPGGHAAGQTRWFNFDVAIGVRSPMHDEDRVVQAAFQGFLGLGPRLERRSPATLTCERAFADWRPRIELVNPSPIPVRVESVTVVDERGIARGSPDWLIVEEQASIAGTFVPGHGTCVLELRIDPARRPRSEWQKEVCERRVRITHDGHPAGDVVEVKVGARLGKVHQPPEVVLGIDFGTSNSTVCLVGREHQMGLAVELPESAVAKRDRMASAMFYRGTGSGAMFDFGAKALRSQALEPRNLVRGMKTLINQRKQQTHYFVTSDEGYVPMEATDLLSEFIGELHRRANRTINELAAGGRDGFGFPRVGQIMVPRAVFTHPVGPSPAMIEALYEAAVRQGLVEGTLSVDAFRSDHCVDEATAAIVAYVWLRVLQRMGGPPCQEGTEHVLCVDIGGGTLDVAAAEVEGLAAYLETGQITVRLRACEGDPGFGGDHLDAVIAKEALRAFADKARGAGIELPLQVLEAALEYGESSSGFQDWYENSHHLWPNLKERDLLFLFGRMGGLREAVEKQKRAFDGTQDFRFPFNPGDLYGRGNDSALNEQIDVVLPARHVAELMLTELHERLKHIDSVCHRAGWMASDVNTVLVTGQTNCYRGYCEAIEAYIGRTRDPQRAPLNVVTPLSQSALCPKGCVALGAGIWGVSQTTGADWLSIESEVTRNLTFDVQLYDGPGRYITVEGLARGTVFPAVGVVPLTKPRSAVTLYCNGRPYATLRSDKLVSWLIVEVRGPRDVWFYAGDDPVAYAAELEETL